MTVPATGRADTRRDRVPVAVASAGYRSRVPDAVPGRAGRARHGGIGVVGVYPPADPGAKDDLAKEGRIPWHYGTFFTKGQHMGTGQAPVERCNRQLRDLIVAGRATPSFIVSHELGLKEGPGADTCFDERAHGRTKVLLHPGAA